MIRKLIRLLGKGMKLAAGLALFATMGWAKAPPDWVKPYLAEDVTELARGQAAVSLVDAGDVRYVAEDRVRRICRGAIRIVTEQGRGQARCAYAFNADTERIRGAQAWFISRDGKSCRSVTVRDFADSAAQVGRFFWPQQRVLSLAAGDRIEVGGVLAWEFDAESQSGISDLNWSFASHLPVNASVLEVTPLPGGKLEWHATSERVSPPTAGSAPGALRWEQRRIAAPTGERPDGFFATPFVVSVRAIAPGGAQTWANFARLAATVIEPRIADVPAVKAKAEALVAGKTTRWERIRALTEFVQKEIAYLAVTLDKDYLAGYRPHAVGEVLENRFGDCKDKSALLAALLRAIGENATVMMVYAGNPKGVRPDWPAASFNHAIVGVTADAETPVSWPLVEAGGVGRLVLFDPTDAQTPLGVLSPSLRGGYGLAASAQADGLVTLPAGGIAHDRYESRVEAALGMDGVLTAHITEVSHGAPGVQFRAQREQLRNDRFGQSLEARLQETMTAVRDLKWTDSWDPVKAQWGLEFDFKAERYAKRTAGNLMLVSPQVTFTKTRLAPWKTTQEGVVWFGSASLRKDVKLTLPIEAIVEELPEDWSQQLEGVACRVKYRRESHLIVCEATFTHEARFLDRATYEALRNLVQKMQEAERRPVVIRLGPAANPSARESAGSPPAAGAVK